MPTPQREIPLRPIDGGKKALRPINQTLNVQQVLLAKLAMGGELYAQSIRELLGVCTTHVDPSSVAVIAEAPLDSACAAERNKA